MIGLKLYLYLPASGNSGKFESNYDRIETTAKNVRVSILEKV